ncbi:unnamed protein product [Linum tenue]|uniref:Uncharacterized protein n=1 Tax=Linum tenue TaxID=586396 RepID=A0AAV0K8R1_9ROSI|nr:unnamed protein product [Linum tenue]
MRSKATTSTRAWTTLSCLNQWSQLGSKLPISATQFQLLIRWSGFDILLLVVKHFTFSLNLMVSSYHLCFCYWP